MDIFCYIICGRPLIGNSGRQRVDVCRYRDCDIDDMMLIVEGYSPCETVSCVEHEVCRLTPDDAGRHSATCVCRDQHCDAVVRPICASDGRSYDNECEMRRHSCTVQRLIVVRSHGLCGTLHLIRLSLIHI